MTARKKPTLGSWNDPDDAPQLTHELATRAQVTVGGKIIREATGTVTKRGRPPVGDERKQQVTLRLAPRVIRYFKGTGDGWQTRLNETLEEYVTRAVVVDARKRKVSVHEIVRRAAQNAMSAAAEKKVRLSGNSLTTRIAATGKTSGKRKILPKVGNTHKR